MKKIVFIVFALVVASFISFGQGKGYYQKTYLEGKTAFEKEEYLLAFQKFSGITEPVKNNNFSNYASYYAMKSALKLRNWSQVERIGLNCLKKEKKWKQLDEIRYLMVCAYYEKNTPELALKLALEIKDEKIKKDERALTSHKVYQLPKGELKNLNQLIPEDELVARALVFKLSGSNDVEDQYLMNYIYQEYDLSDSLFSVPERAADEHKDEYCIAVLLPMNFGSSNPNRARFLEMAAGMQLAVDSLMSDSLRTKLLYFDTKRDSVEIQSILNKLNGEEVDLIVGPVYPEGTKLVDNYATQRGIQCVNPLQTKQTQDTVLNNTLFYKAQSIDLAKSLSQYALDSMEAGDVLILSTKKSHDSVLAAQYEMALSKSKKFKTHVLFIDDSNPREIQRVLHRIEYQGNISHVFAATKQRLVGSYLMTALEQENILKPALVPFKWTKIQTNTFEQYQRHNVQFYSSVSLGKDSLDTHYEEFEKRFETKMTIRPITDHAAIGFDLVWGFRTLLENDGVYFYSHNSFSDVEGPVLGDLIFEQEGIGNNNVWIYELDEKMKLQQKYSVK